MTQQTFEEQFPSLKGKEQYRGNFSAQLAIQDTRLGNKGSPLFYVLIKDSPEYQNFDIILRELGL